MLIETKLGMLDESALRCLVTVTEDEWRKVTAIEHCLSGCEGEPHKTGKAEGDGHFCNQHVRRSVHVEVKKIPPLEGATGVFS